MTPANTSSTTERVGIARPLIVFLVFAILGPPIGGVIAVAALLMAMSLGPDAPSFKGGAEEFEKVAVLFVKIVYFVGGLQAAFVALVALLSTTLRWRGLVSFLAVVTAGLAAGIVFVMVVDRRAPPLAFVIFVGVHVGAAIGCWLIAQGALRLFRQRPAPNDARM
jgi:hypothetical protein